ncbi:MAG: tetratricopeptide repeat protein [Candidatus Omnitrophica bacterium]|nr:tetratricopeptide repeat protein [Candidatus Omnitrophota bacterium]
MKLSKWGQIINKRTRASPVPTIFFCFFMITFFSAQAFALEWVNLHEQSDKLTGLESAEIAAAEYKTIDSLYVLGLTYLAEYKDDAAQTIFLEILSKAPDTIEAKWGLGEVARRKYKLAQASQIFEELILQSPDFSPSYISLAYIKFNLKDYKQAILLAKQVINQGQKNVDTSNYVRAYLILAGANGMLAENGGPLAKVIHGIGVFSMLKKAEKLQPECPGVYFGLGTFYLMAPGFAGGDIEKSFIYLEQAIQLDPNLIDVYARLAQAYKQKGDIPKFKEYLNLALEKDPNNLLSQEIRQENLLIIQAD